MKVLAWFAFAFGHNPLSDVLSSGNNKACDIWALAWISFQRMDIRYIYWKVSAAGGGVDWERSGRKREEGQEGCE